MQEEIRFFWDDLVTLKMIYHLFYLNIFLMILVMIGSHDAGCAWWWERACDSWTLEAKSFKFYTVTYGLPFEVIHWMYWWYLYPPISPLYCLSDQTRIIPWNYDKLITILYVSIGEGNFRYRFLWSSFLDCGGSLCL